MLKCINQESKEFVIILDPRWKARLRELRKLDDQNRLVCPVCHQPVRLRTGNVRVWHFAHKHLKNCPLQFESPQLIQTRAALYEWLLNYFPAENVTVEKIILDLPFPRHIDCWVDREPVSVIYWIIDSRRPPAERTDLQKAFEACELQTHTLFTSTMLHPDEFSPQNIFLTTTERAFMTSSQFDQSIRGYGLFQGKTLHYLDAENRLLITYRNLHLVHPPQEFAGTPIHSPLASVAPFSSNGEFLHPGEERKLQKIQIETQYLFEKQQRTIPSLLKKAPLNQREGSSLNPVPSFETTAGQDKDRNPFEKNAPCSLCGKTTSDWITYDGKTGTCLCRSCYNIQNENNRK
jgi:hypothetical protein